MSDIEYLCRRCHHSLNVHREVDYGPIGMESECGFCSCRLMDKEDNLDYLLRVGKEKAARIAQAALQEPKPPRAACVCRHGTEWHEKGKCWFLDCLC